MMKTEFLNPFISAAIQILQSEANVKTVQRGSLSIESSSRTSKEVTILVAITGSISGMVLYGMNEVTALKVVSGMSGEPIEEFSELAQSGIAEFGNMVTGNASMALEKAGYPSNISPPTLILGRNTRISTIDVKRMVVPFMTGVGNIEIDLAVKLNR